MFQFRRRHTLTCINTPWASDDELLDAATMMIAEKGADMVLGKPALEAIGIAQ